MGGGSGAEILPLVSNEVSANGSHKTFLKISRFYILEQFYVKRSVEQIVHQVLMCPSYIHGVLFLDSYIIMLHLPKLINQC